MERHTEKILARGDKSGNCMVVRFRLPSGLEIIGLPTRNFYGGHWDLGPTWNYAVLADEPFLVDSGRYGQGKNLLKMMDAADLKPEDLSFVLISHGHEDHDGGLAELVHMTNLKVRAHAIYDLIIRKYPKKAPPGYKEDFPAKCWHCEMPEEFFTRNCVEYHNVLQGLRVDSIADGTQEIAKDIRTCHLPGHSPDCLAILIGDEAVLVGDIVLPQISPWPTRVALYEDLAQVINPLYDDPEAILGLHRYIKSLKKLGEIAEQHPDILVLPGHRFYYNDNWNRIRLGDRVNELLQHHRDRCTAILEILRSGPKTAREIAREHFDENLLKGYGMLMAANEVISHCELMIKCGDLVATATDTYQLTGSASFEKAI